MAAAILVLAACCLSAAWAQQQQYTTPIPILKQINRQNEDGSYSYGYEGADGSYKIETKHASGEVYGKYGYVDDGGNRREIEYGANKLGFQPAGTDINVAPPTLPDPNNNYVGPDGVDDGQYREDPSVYYTDSKYNSAPRSSGSTTYSRTQYNQPGPSFSRSSYSQPSYSQSSYSQPSYSQSNYRQSAPQQSFNSYDSQPAPQQSYNSQPSFNQRSWNAGSSWNGGSSWNSPAQYNPPVDSNIFRGHPASNFDVYTGSYTINYKK